MIERILDALFRHIDLVLRDDQEYLRRWIIFHRPSGRSLYIHKISASDWSRDPHDHPKNFTSVGLWRRYTEEVYVLGERTGLRIPIATREFRAPWFRRFRGEHIHRLLLPEGAGPCWTLVYTGPAYKAWGFYKPTGEFVPHGRYFEENA